MAVSRGMLLLCLGTLMVSVVLIKVAEANDHHSGPCHGDPNKGDQCLEDEEDIIGDDDVDETYKIVNKVAVSFTGRLGDFEETGSTPQESEEAEPGDAEEDQSHLIVLGH
ncbi:PREDICTED: CCACVL1_05173 [Prunus dulcis]|uniref:PREDICTED: CCACVL1_05173 n=1 Tax=Prunus dulcis TaxID=3755 RepID=A0A5E4EQY8_PRUDU|nr:protein RALF-like 17 [Prunus dulcis]KAI5340217.1 hypothetical protein L3X38_019491 [Prunus dulcis]VVA17510.1 PREDICTED: CCACVL1_05173 [Prunus dulcis]